MKILNLYAGIGGNRKLWTDCEVTAVELNPEIAGIYKDFFPFDFVEVGDAHKYLAERFKNFDFIWSSPPCQSHSRMRQFVGVNAKGYKPIYPDMSLYQQIIFLQANAKCRWVVENVNPYYEPLVKPTARLGRHLFWSNFPIGKFETASQNLRTRNKISDVEALHDIDLSAYKIADKRQILRNCVDPELGRHIFNEAVNAKL